MISQTQEFGKALRHPFRRSSHKYELVNKAINHLGSTAHKYVHEFNFLLN